MKNRIKSFFVYFLTVVFLVVAGFSASYVSAQTVNSNCVITKIGSPGSDPVLPPECSQSGSGPNGPCGTALGMNLTKINPNLVLAADNSFERLSGNQSSPCYTTTSASSKYWCTNSIIDSYRLAGIAGLDQSKHLAVVEMHKFWDSPAGQAQGYKFTRYTGGAFTVSPGDAIFFEQTYKVHTKQHVAMIKSTSIDERGNGTIETLESNSSKKQKKYPVANWAIKNTVHPVAGFGGR